MFSKGSEASKQARAAAKMRQQQHQEIGVRSSSSSAASPASSPQQQQQQQQQRRVQAQTQTHQAPPSVGIQSFFLGDPAPASRSSPQRQTQQQREEEGNDREEENPGPHPMIYSVPTTDTLGDESALVARRYPVQTPSSGAGGSVPVGGPAGLASRFPPYAGYSSQQQHQQQQQPSAQQEHATRYNTPMRSNKQQQPPPPPPPSAPPKTSSMSPMRSLSPMRASGRTSSSASPYRPHQQGAAAAISPNRAPNNNSGSRRSRRRKKRYYPNRDFQHEHDAIAVTVQPVSVDQRSAFEMRPAISPQRWEQLAQQSAAGGAGSGSKMYKRMSPSLQHLELLHFQQSIDTVRQIQFSPSASASSDILYQRQQQLGGDNRPQPRGVERDGRYRCIDPIDALPKTSQVPQLAHKKVRLPTRADVGWPNSSEDEIRAKQREIQWEAEWEEVSPRLVVLVTSDDLGRAVIQSDASVSSSYNEDALNTSVDSRDGSSVDSNMKRRRLLKRRHMQWNGGGIGGMPFCGPELLEAKAQNVRFFGRSDGDDDDDSVGGDNSRTVKCPPRSSLNPYSALAPPLDAIFSPSKIWRPRPFHDRPAGRKYGLACPLSVELGLKTQEPFICSLTLYTLPVGTTSSHRQRHRVACGKMSEEFWFPAGNWDGKVYLDAVRREDGTLDGDLVRAWLHRKHKAIFSYDPLALGGTSSSGVGNGDEQRQYQQSDVFVLLQVYKLAHPTATTTYQQQQKDKAATASPSRQFKDAEIVRKRADRVYQQFGTQILSPLCFGLAKFYSSSTKVDGHSNSFSSDMNADEGIDSMKFPQGETRDVRLFAYPAKPESQESFLARLASIAHLEHYDLSTPSSTQKPDLQLSHQPSIDDSKSMVSDAMFSMSSETTKKRRGGIAVGRLFKKASPKLPQGQVNVAASADRAASFETNTNGFSSSVVDGEAKLFVSSLSSDFLQAMLANPSEWQEQDTNSRLPRLLVDASGDLGVMLDPGRPVQAPMSTGSSSPAVVNLRKRSNLLRLPVPSEPAGYVPASEFREVHYLPARPEKHYDVDTELSYRSLLNLLYLYPRLLRLSNESGGVLDPAATESGQFTIRVQVVQSKTIVDEDSGQIETRSDRLNVFHNPSPWAGPALVNEMYTKTFGDVTYGEEKESLDLKSGIPIRDEIKIRLPEVLDGSFSLHVSLFAVEPSDKDLALRPIAEALVPLSSSSSRDSTSAIGRVATIIPNGNHRLRLGSFQLQLETRLVSSVHVGDPAVATVLRDFPYAKERDMFDGNASSWLDSVGHFGDAFPKILSEASASTVTVHFDVLLYIHLCNLVNLHDKRGREGNKIAKFMIGNMQSLFEVFSKVKAKFLASPLLNSEEQLQSFLKKHLDLFDERCLSPASGPLQSRTESTDGDQDAGSEVLHSPSQEDDGDVDFDNESRLDGSVLLRRKSERLSQHELRVSRIAATLGRSGVPFSRVAYGASKTDRMRIEAEIQKEGVYLGHFFDDDETIATLATATTYPPPIETQMTGKDPETLLSVRGIALRSTSDNQLIQSVSPSSASRIDDGVRRSSSSAEFAQRVRTAAQVMLAPCVGPSLSNILAKSNSPPVAARDEKKEDYQQSERLAKLQSTPRDSQDSISGCVPGSDVEEEDYLVSKDSFDASFAALSGGATFRGPPDGPMLLFTVRSNKSHEVPVSSGEYVYESIMLLWLRAWLDHVESSLTEPLDASSVTGRQFATFPIPENDFFSPQSQRASIFSYYDHMDVLLPVCLKSVALRYSVEVLPMYPPTTKALVDDRHMIVLEPFVEMLARGLIGQAIAGLGSLEGRDLSLIRSLSSAEHVLGFLVGLLGILHPEHVHSLLRKFFRTLRDGETEHLGESFSDTDFEWNEESLHRVRSSRQLRLKAIETLAVLPAFVSLNYPPKYVCGQSATTSRPKKATWKQQYSEIPDNPSQSGGKRPLYPDRIERLPSSGWLSDLLISEGLSVCTLCCEAVVAEAMAHIELSSVENPKTSSVATPSLKKRPGASLRRADLLMLQSLAIHAITAVYELIVRRHSMDRRYQTDSCRERIAGLFATPILDKSISSSRWLARMEATHKVRSLWLLCFVYILQEAPESQLRHYIRSLCNPRDVRIHRFIRLLRLCCSTFQSFIDLPRHALLPSEIDKGLSPWLLQESFNTICAATNMVVEECVTLTSCYPREQERMMTGILDLLLHLLTTPQSSVTHLRAVGGALQALEEFGVDLFIEISGTNLQHWIRVILSLMNSTSLSVRSIAVDFVVSLLGNTYELDGDIDSVSIIFVTVLPEVAAREIALYSVSGLISTAEDMVRCLWPLRRSIADLEDANPLDDDRVDPQLVPVLSVFCRACQAILDGVLIEMRLRGNKASVVGTRVAYSMDFDVTFDADEESLFEAATFFVPETAPMQRIRWLLTLKSLHESKGQWVEAAETLYLCARTVSDSMPHLKNVWRPSKFVLWSDSKRSLWLDSVGEEMGRPDRGNTEVMDFADSFLEPNELFGTSWKASVSGKLQQPTVPIMSTMLIQVAKDAVELYLREEGMDELAHIRLESLLKAVINVIDTHSSVSQSRGGFLALGSSARKRHIEDEAALRRVLASVSGDMTKLAERLLLLVQSEPNTPEPSSSFSPSMELSRRFTVQPQYVVVHVSGKKPPRFAESIGLPTFLEFDTPCICRLPTSLSQMQVVGDFSMMPKKLCLAFAQPLLSALQKECGSDSVVLVTDVPTQNEQVEDVSKTHLYVFPVDLTASMETLSKSSHLLSKSVYYRTRDDKVIVEMKVAQTFPCALSRQRSLVTTEIAKVQ